MKSNELIRALGVPEGPVDVVLDTDTYNEIDDQFAIAYMMRSPELRTKAIYAAPFFNENSSGPEDGMLKSCWGREPRSIRARRSICPTRARR